MASTNKTTNYELSQFIETDRPAWLTDYNSDMRKLDTALKGVSDVASGASGSISSLTDRMTAAEGAISTNANDIDALEARADALEAQAQSTAGTISNIQTEQTAQNLGIEAATELGYNLARPYDSASTYAVGAYVLFQNTLYKCVTAIATGEAFDPTKWLAIKATDELGAIGSIEYIPLTSSDVLFNVTEGTATKQTNYYSGTYSSNNENITGGSIQLFNPWNNCHLLKIKNQLNILVIALTAQFQDVNLASKQRCKFSFRFTMTSNKIPKPTNTVWSMSTDGTRLFSCMLDNSGGILNLENFFNPADNTLSVGNFSNVSPFIFIY